MLGPPVGEFVVVEAWIYDVSRWKPCEKSRPMLKSRLIEYGPSSLSSSPGAEILALGTTLCPLHASMPTDRFVAERHLDSPRVHAILSNTHAAAISPSEEIVIPRNIEELKKSDPAGVLELQNSLRPRFTELFAKNLEITDFQVGEKNARYLLTPRSDAHFDR